MRREGKGTLKREEKKKRKREKTGCSREQLFILGHGAVIGCLARALLERGRFERVPGRWMLIRGTGVKRGPAALGDGALPLAVVPSPAWPGRWPGQG